MMIRSYLSKHLRRLFAAFVFIALVPACIVVVEKDDPHDDDYYRRRWQLEVIVFSSGTYAPRDGGLYTVSFDNEDVLSGQADCVSFEARYEVGRTSTLTVNNMTSGNDQCSVDSLAPMYLEELASARSISGNADELVIHLDGTDNIMKFRPR